MGDHVRSQLRAGSESFTTVITLVQFNLCASSSVSGEDVRIEAEFLGKPED